MSNHIYDYIRKHWREIPSDIISIYKLIVIEEWEDVTALEVQKLIETFRTAEEEP